MKKDITELYCWVEDFCRAIDENFANRFLSNGKKPTRVPEIAHSEILTIILLYYQSPCKNFKAFYLCYLQLLYRSYFSKLPWYHRFIDLKPGVLWYLALLLQWFCEQAKMTGISYIKASRIAVCHKKRISRNKVFSHLAEISKGTYGWFFGFKLHLVIN